MTQDQEVAVLVTYYETRQESWWRRRQPEQWKIPEWQKKESALKTEVMRKRQTQRGRAASTKIILKTGGEEIHCCADWNSEDIQETWYYLREHDRRKASK